MLLDHLNEDIDVVFVGISFGAWIAAKLAKLYSVNCILINPILHPKHSELIPDNVLYKYEQLTIEKDFVFFLTNNEELVELIEILDNAGNEYHVDEEVTHQYSGKHFVEIIEKINDMSNNK